MYNYNEFDTAFLAERNAQFRAQVERRIDGSLTEEEFRPLRLMNGLYLQLHAYMLRVAIPYGTLNSAQLRQLALLADKLLPSIDVKVFARDDTASAKAWICAD